MSLEYDLQRGIVLCQPSYRQIIAAVPQGIDSVPRGMECLVPLDQLFVKQKTEILEVIGGFETTNKYTILDQQGQLLFSAKEESDCFSRNCFGRIRPFNVSITRRGEEIILLDRPFACQSIFFPCCLQVLDVYAPSGILAGKVEQNWNIFPSFDIKNAFGQPMFRIEGPFCNFSCLCGEVDFKILKYGGQTEIGKISKKWSGLAKEIFTDANNFGISFPKDLNVEQKATLLGACFLIDFMYFEKAHKLCG